MKTKYGKVYGLRLVMCVRMVLLSPEYPLQDYAPYNFLF